VSLADKVGDKTEKIVPAGSKLFGSGEENNSKR